ncbi:unnamed protein product [Clonostachys byssicola]|uniref:Heterokaryon incompatibility domain-containing protein n=1 Tax=Clonostachys byssicola TaxID=160290 RepID=A0A9N9YCU6_9HYPO|nr:unnamed protein product [Clonostachys byssicola]
MDPLCQRCQAFDIQAFAKDQYEYRGYKLKDLLESATQGCSFCSMLVENLELVVQGKDQRLLRGSKRGLLENSQSQAAKWFSKDQLALLFMKLYSTVNTTWVHFTAGRASSHDVSRLEISFLRVFISLPSLETLKGDAFTYNIFLHTAADPGTKAYDSGDITGSLYVELHHSVSTHLSTIKSWQKQCIEGHEECVKTMSKTNSINPENVPLPSRCLEVVTNDLQQHPDAPPYTFVLRETSGSGKYITLSHRWTEETEKYKTLTKNLNCRMGLCDVACQQCQGSPMELMPLFRDAGQLSAGLGIKYLWIDTLCIVQDDNLDWEKESGKMADYYQNSWLTISATSLSVDGGLFGDVPSESMPRITRLPYRDKERVQHGHFYVQCMEAEALSMDYKTNISQSSLLSRGWVCQEWLLSRRILSFSKAGLFVQCQIEPPRSLLGDEVNDTAHYGSTGISSKRIQGIDTLSLFTILESWFAVVEVFSGLELKNLEEDRLIALAGVAKEFGLAIEREQGEEGEPGNGLEATKHRYVSGLWFGQWRCLLWEQVSTGERVRIGGIPSWSWASMAVRKTSNQESNAMTGMPVQWTTLPQDDELPTCVCSFAGARTVPTIDALEGNYRTFKPMYEHASVMPPENEYHARHRFTMLQMKGRLLTTHIDQRFNEFENANIAAELTEHSPDLGRHMWRRVTIPTELSVISGWASLEHPEYQTDISATNSTLEAFVVTRSDGNVLGLPPSFRVIFLRRVEIPGFDSCFERVGTGGLFDAGVDKLFREANEEMVWLV